MLEQANDGTGWGKPTTQYIQQNGGAWSLYSDSACLDITHTHEDWRELVLTSPN